MEKLVVAKSASGSSKPRKKCSHCGIWNHTRDQCHKLNRVCYSCKKPGHIARDCKTASNNTDAEGDVASSVAGVPTNATVLPGERLFVKGLVSGQEFKFLYDTGSQLTLLQRSDYESLASKPPITPIGQNGITVDGQSFTIDGAIYVNLELRCADGTTFMLPYETVLVCPNIKSNILGISAEKRFSSVLRDNQKMTLTYTTYGSSEPPVTVKCFKEVTTPTHAFIEIAKATVVHKYSTAFVPTRVKGQRKDMGSPLIDPILSDVGGLEPVFADSPLPRTLRLPYTNDSSEDVYLKRGTKIADVHETISEEVTVCRDIEVANTSVATEEMISDPVIRSIWNEYEEQVQKPTKKLMVEHEILLTETKPVNVPERRTPYAYREEITKELAILLEKNFIVESNSNYNAPLVPVIKNDGSLRLCLDYRRLNAVTVPSSFPIRRSDDLFDCVRGSKVFSVIDLKSAYHQITLKREDCHKTAFSFDGEKYEWTRLPFGLQGGAFSLTAALKEVLKGKSFCRNIYDDIIVFSKDKSEHMIHLREVFSALAEYGLLVNLSKCQLALLEVVFFGHILSEDGIRPSKNKLGDIVKFKTPQNQKEVHSFLGMCSFFRKFIPHFSENSAVLFDLLKKGKEFTWGEQENNAFECIKESLSGDQLLVHPDFEKPFIIVSDASKNAIGFMIGQIHNNVNRPILFGGRVLQNAERNYDTTNKELLGVFFAVKSCSVYVIGHEFYVYTDHKPLIYLKTFRDILEKRYRWIQFLEDLGTKILYIPGKENVVSDFVSRNPKEEKPLDVLTCMIELNALNYSVGEILASQMNDPLLNALYNHLTKFGECPKEFSRFKKCIKLDTVIKYNNRGNWLMVAPKEFQDEILWLCHHQFCSGHLGIYKTHKRVLSLFWWPTLRADVINYIARCKDCLSIKSGNRKLGKLGIRELPMRPLDLVSIDFIVNLPVTKRGNSILMVINDHFSKFLQLYPLRNREAVTAARALLDYVLKFGIPLKLYSDRDPAYEAKLFQELMQMLGIKKLRTTGYNPKANGLTEKSNQFTKNYLTAYCQEHPTEWDMWHREASYAFNSSTQVSTGHTAAKVMFGREYRMPLNILYGSNQISDRISFREYESEMQKLYDLVRLNMETRQKVNATYYDKKVRDDVLSLGQKVLILDPRVKGNWLKPKYNRMGIVRNVRHPAYQVEIDKVGDKQWFTRDRLRKNLSSHQVETEKEITEVDLEDDDEKSSRDEDELVEDELVIPRRGGRLRPNPEIPQRLGEAYSHASQIIHCSMIDCSLEFT